LFCCVLFCFCTMPGWPATNHLHCNFIKHEHTLSDFLRNLCLHQGSYIKVPTTAWQLRANGQTMVKPRSKWDLFESIFCPLLLGS
jgi:hypothetical protein